TLWAEHLGRVPDDRSMLDPTESLALWRDAAARLAARHRRGRPRPHPGCRILEHQPAPVADDERWWVFPLYRTIYDPDGRWRPDRLRGRF
ncbi:MAG: phospholipase, partial [Candidatus Dormibacteria bacterium]